MICAKQSQFPAAPGGARHRGRGAWGVVQTKPISGPCRSRGPTPPGAPAARTNKAKSRRAQQRPRRFLRRSSGLAPAEPIAPNKAKLGQDGISGWCDREPCCAKQSQFPATPGGTRPGGRGAWGVVQTNPICPAGPGGTEPGEPGSWAVVQTKPICPAEPGGTEPGDRGRGLLYKQSQLGLSVRTLAGGLRETNPILRLRIADHVIASDAWQSGLRIGHRPAAGRPLRAARPGAGCTNKANWPGRIAPNKPNFGHGKEKGKWFVRKDLGPTRPAKSTGKTKPIPGRPGSEQGPARSIQRNKANLGRSFKFEGCRGGPPWPPSGWAGTGACPYTLQTRPKAVRAERIFRHPGAYL